MDNFIRGEKPKILIKSRHKSNFEMKVRGVLGVLSLVLLISCGKDTVVPEPTPIVPGSSDLKPVLFSVGTISEGRAEEMNSSNFIVDGRRLGVFAYKHSGELIDGVDIANVRNFPLTYRGTNWTYSPYLYWPNNADTLYSFVGIYPYMSDYSDQFSYNVDGENLSISYNLGSDASNQVDMLYAVAKNCSVEGGEVDLNFKHALSKVGLSIAGNVSGTGVDSVLIKEVQLLGVAKSGIMTVSSDFSEIDWSTGETTDVCILNGTQKLSATSTQIGDWQYLVPQNIETSPINVSLIYYVYTNSSNIPQTKKSVFELPNDVVASWEDNHTYNYTLSLNLSEVSFDVDIDVVDFESGADVDLNIPNPDDTLPETGELNVIYYRSTDGSVIEPYVEGDSPWGGAQIVSNTYENGYGKIVFDDIIRSIPYRAFYDETLGKNSTLAEIIIPDSVTEISAGAFESCLNLGKIVLGDAVVKIGGWAFYNCSSLKDVYIPKSVTYIDEDAFRFYGYHRSIETIEVSPDNPIYDSRNACNAIVETSTNRLIVGSNNTIIPEGVVTIAECAFEWSTIEEISLPNSVKYIEQSAFNWCRKLSNVILSESLISIADYAFEISPISELTVPSSVEYIGRAALCASILNFESIIPCEVASDFISGTGVINVPEEAIDAYTDADYWVAYRHLINGYIEPEMNLVMEIVDDIQIAYSATSYEGVTYSIDEIYGAFGLDEDNLQNATDAGRFDYYAEDSDGTLHQSNGNTEFSSWWGVDGNVTGWGANAMVFFEGSTPDEYTVGQYPGHCTIGAIYPSSHLIIYLSKGEKKAIRVKVNVEIVE